MDLQFINEKGREDFFSLAQIISIMHLYNEITSDVCLDLSLCVSFNFLFLEKETTNLFSSLTICSLFSSFFFNFLYSFLVFLL